MSDLTPRASPGLPAASARLRRKIELALPPWAGAYTALVRHRDVRALFGHYLVRTHRIIRATESLMSVALQKAEESAFRDPVAAGVAEYLQDHIVDEKGHDEWLLEDLSALGMDRATVLSGVPSDTIACLVGAQYYWSLHCHPVALLGYFATMEGHPPSTELIERLINATGYPREAFRTLIEHGELDPHHRDELDRRIDSLPLTEEHEKLLGLSAISTITLLARSIEEVIEESA